ncbi:sialidase family protein [Pseudomonas nicosulfuronedens]
MKSALAVFCAGVFGFAWQTIPVVRVADFMVASIPAEAGVAAMPPKHRFASSNLKDFVHSASIAALPGGGLMSVWFAGTREGAADVQIRSSVFDPQLGRWSPERVLVSRELTAQSVHKSIRKLGNPVIALSPEGRLWLFYVSVSFGGWGGSAINAMYSDDLGKAWSPPRQLVTTPFLNLSTLVRGAPTFHRDGSIGLPVYQELLGKFAEYLYLSPEGQVLDKFRISKGRHSLQPSVVAQDGRHAVALLRYAGKGHRRVLASRSSDAGQTWSEPVALEPSNPNSSLAAVGRPNGNLLVALNDLDRGRFSLTLYETDAQLWNWRLVAHLDESPDPWGDPVTPEVFSTQIDKAWRDIDAPQLRGARTQFLDDVQRHMCKSGKCRFEFEYPYMQRDALGVYHLVYSWNDTFIKHVSFTDAWVEGEK